jgi:hypothetical protein
MATLDDFKPYIAPELPQVDSITLENYLRLAIGDFCEKTWIINKVFTHTFDIGDIDTDMNKSVIISIPGYVKNLRPVFIGLLMVDGERWDLQYQDFVNGSNFFDEFRLSERKVFSFPSPTTIRIAPFEKGSELMLKVVFKPLLR